MEERVKLFLEDYFKGMKADLETMTNGRISGQIVWAGFDGEEHIVRQTTVREKLREKFGADAQYIGVLLAYTPTEIKEMVAV